MSRSRRFDKRDFWDGGRVERKKTHKIKQKDRAQFTSFDKQRAENSREIKGEPGKYDPSDYEE